MGDNDQNRLKLLGELIEKLKKIEGDQQSTIEHLAKVQMDIQEAGKESLASKVGELFANATKNTELLHEMLHELTMELNRLRQGN